jgi:DNA-binding HxlR family transcriptional regulator
MPPQPAADRPAIPHETSPGGSSPQAWPRFEVCIDGRRPIEDTLNAIAGRWKILILWWLQEGEMRFSELRRRVPSITQKVLTQQLRQMEEEGLVCREVFAQVPPKVIYSLAERGTKLAASASQSLRLVTRPSAKGKIGLKQFTRLALSELQERLGVTFHIELKVQGVP